MLTPMDIRNHELKTTMGGYNKKDTDEFIQSVCKSYEVLYKENHDLKEQVSSLSDGIQYYKQMETTLQKALVIAEKTSSEIQDAAKVQAEATLKEAQTRAEAIESQTRAEIELMKSKAEHDLNSIKEQLENLSQSYRNYRRQFRELLKSQMDMLEDEDFDIPVLENEEIRDEETYTEETYIEETNTEEAFEKTAVETAYTEEVLTSEEPDAEENTSYAAETDEDYSEQEELSAEEIFEKQDLYSSQLYEENASEEVAEDKALYTEAFEDNFSDSINSEETEREIMSGFNFIDNDFEDETENASEDIVEEPRDKGEEDKQTSPFTFIDFE